MVARDAFAKGSESEQRAESREQIERTDRAIITCCVCVLDLSFLCSQSSLGDVGVGGLNQNYSLRVSACVCACVGLRVSPCRACACACFVLACVVLKHTCGSHSMC